MSQVYHIGDRVRWSWGANTATGRISERFTDRVTRTIKGVRRRNARPSLSVSRMKSIAHCSLGGVGAGSGTRATDTRLRRCRRTASPSSR